MSLTPLSLNLPPKRLTLAMQFALSLLLCAAPVAAQKKPDDIGLPKYDLQTETKTKGVVETVNLLSVGARKDFTELVVKSGDDTLHIYLCPKPFEDEMAISFAKGDEITVTGSKVKQESSDVILARELVRGTDSLLFRDGKGKPVWDPRTGK